MIEALLIGSFVSGSIYGAAAMIVHHLPREQFMGDRHSTVRTAVGLAYASYSCAIVMLIISATGIPV